MTNRSYNRSLREPRLGIMLHYDGSRSDAGSLAWFNHPDCRVSYNWLALDSGEVVGIAPSGCRAWHAGVCRPSSPTLDYADANSAFYGIAAATDRHTPVTDAQLTSIADLCIELYQEHGWSLEREIWRITEHRMEAWPRGRKMDPYPSFTREQVILRMNNLILG